MPRQCVEKYEIRRERMTKLVRPTKSFSKAALHFRAESILWSSNRNTTLTFASSGERTSPMLCMTCLCHERQTYGSWWCAKASLSSSAVTSVRSLLVMNPFPSLSKTLKASRTCFSYWSTWRLLTFLTWSSHLFFDIRILEFPERKTLN